MAERILTLFCAPIVTKRRECRPSTSAHTNNEESLVCRAVDLRVDHVGPHHADTPIAWGQLTRFYHIVGRCVEAVESVRGGIEAQRMALGANRPRLGKRRLLLAQGQSAGFRIGARVNPGPVIDSP